MTETLSLKEYARCYVDTLNQAPNGWGAHICKRTGLVSDVVYRKGREQFGQAFDDELNAIWRREDP